MWHAFFISDRMDVWKTLHPGTPTCGTTDRQPDESDENLGMSGFRCLGTKLQLLNQRVGASSSNGLERAQRRQGGSSGWE